MIRRRAIGPSRGRRGEGWQVANRNRGRSEFKRPAGQVWKAGGSAVSPRRAAPTKEDLPGARSWCAAAFGQQQLSIPAARVCHSANRLWPEDCVRYVGGPRRISNSVEQSDVITGHRRQSEGRSIRFFASRMKKKRLRPGRQADRDRPAPAPIWCARRIYQGRLSPCRCGPGTNAAMLNASWRMSSSPRAWW